MKATLTITVIFGAVLGLAATLYIVMKDSLEYRKQTAQEMQRIWSQEAPAELGPFLEAGVEWWVTLPPGDSGWTIEIQGEKLLIRMNSLGFRSVPESSDAPSAELSEKLWQASLPQLRERLAKTFKMDRHADQIEILRP